MCCVVAKMRQGNVYRIVISWRLLQYDVTSKYVKSRTVSQWNLVWVSPLTYFGIPCHGLMCLTSIFHMLPDVRPIEAVVLIRNKHVRPLRIRPNARCHKPSPILLYMGFKPSPKGNHTALTESPLPHLSKFPSLNPRHHWMSPTGPTKKWRFLLRPNHFRKITGANYRFAMCLLNYVLDLLRCQYRRCLP